MSSFEGTIVETHFYQQYLIRELPPTLRGRYDVLHHYLWARKDFFIWAWPSFHRTPSDSRLSQWQRFCCLWISHQHWFSFLTIIFLCRSGRYFFTAFSNDAPSTWFQRVYLQITLWLIIFSRHPERAWCTKMTGTAWWETEMIGTSVIVWRMTGAPFRFVPDMQSCMVWSQALRIRTSATWRQTCGAVQHFEFYWHDWADGLCGDGGFSDVGDKECR